MALALFALASGATAADVAPRGQAYANELGERVNAYRKSRGLAPLAVDERLARLAIEHSARMAKSDRPSHDGFDERFRAARYPTCVENVGWDSPTPAAQLAAWQHSPVHERNLVNPRLTAMGIGVHGRYATMFACGR